jgi:hypothetical protein
MQNANRHGNDKMNENAQASPYLLPSFLPRPCKDRVPYIIVVYLLYAFPIRFKRDRQAALQTG